MAYELKYKISDEALRYLNLKIHEDDVWCLTKALEAMNGECGWAVFENMVAAIKSDEDEIVNPPTFLEKLGHIINRITIELSQFKDAGYVDNSYNDGFIDGLKLAKKLYISKFSGEGKNEGGKVNEG